MKKLIFILIISFLQICFAQNFEKRLQNAYDRFNNTVLDSILSQAAAGYENLSDPDKIIFHKFKAFRAFQMGEPQIVQNHFRALITIDPVYTLDPLSTSPKLLTLYDKTKIEYLERQQQYLKILSEQKELAATPWRSLIFPGWEQWHRGAKTKGYVWMAAGTITLTGTIQAFIRTSIKHQAYLDEQDPAQVTKKYQAYNEVYQSQYYWAYGLLTVWIASHVDAVFFTENKNLELVMYNDSRDALIIGVNVRF